MPHAISDGLRIEYDDLGQGEPAVLLMPGWCSGRAALDDLATILSRHRRVLALDWRGHGQSQTPVEDFGLRQLADDALAVIEASGAAQVAPVAMAHAGWVALELRAALGRRVPALTLVDWIILQPPPEFRQTLRDLQSPRQWRQAAEDLFGIWRDGMSIPQVEQVFQNMAAYGFEMWSRAAREVEAAYEQAGSPLRAMAQLHSPPPVLHLYCQPPAEEYLAAQQCFAAGHEWFHVQRLRARTHMAAVESPREVAEGVDLFLSGNQPEVRPAAAA